MEDGIDRACESLSQPKDLKSLTKSLHYFYFSWCCGVFFFVFSFAARLFFSLPLCLAQYGFSAAAFWVSQEKFSYSINTSVSCFCTLTKIVRVDKISINLFKVGWCFFLCFFLFLKYLLFFLVCVDSFNSDSFAVKSYAFVAVVERWRKKWADTNWKSKY